MAVVQGTGWRVSSSNTIYATEAEALAVATASSESDDAGHPDAAYWPVSYTRWEAE
ncbi:hypothetical protein SEA_STELLA_41 [Streptomyces phage Stella]|nr:hypothetical protein SEA_STELLA_41 [Streptomyces phage Stella]